MIDIYYKVDGVVHKTTDHSKEAFEKANPHLKAINATSKQKAECATCDKNRKAIRKRVSEYPAIGEQLDAIMKWVAGDDTEIKAIAAKCQAVKAKYPKETN